MEGCKHCNEGINGFDYNNCVLKNEGTEKWIDYVETGNYIEYENSGFGYWECIETEVMFCKMCGIKL